MFRSRVLILIVVVAVGMLFAPLSASASPIVVVSGPDATTTFSTLSNPIALAVGFSTSSDYVNVNIGITLASFLIPGNVDFQVFLTDQLGLGTTVANQIATASPNLAVAASPVVFPYTLTPVTLLQGVTLPAGNYFLSFISTVNVGPVNVISSPDSSVVTSAAGGVTVTQNFLAGNPVDPYVPASGFGDILDTNLWFSVTGDLAQAPPAAVPEPATVLLVGSGLAAAIRRRSRRSQETKTSASRTTTTKHTKNSKVTKSSSWPSISS